MIPNFSEVEKVLQERAAPVLIAHQGGIRLKGISQDGVVRVAFQGSCTNCPLLGDTLSDSVETALQEAFPKAHLKVVAVDDVDDALWSLAKNILRNKKN